MPHPLILRAQSDDFFEIYCYTVVNDVRTGVISRDMAVARLAKFLGTNLTTRVLNEAMLIHE